MLLRWKTIYLNEKITRLICQFRVDERWNGIWYMVFYAQQKVETTRNNKLKTAQETDKNFIQAKSGKRKN